MIYGLPPPRCADSGFQQVSLVQPWTSTESWGKSTWEKTAPPEPHHHRSPGHVDSATPKGWRSPSATLTFKSHLIPVPRGDSSGTADRQTNTAGSQGKFWIGTFTGPVSNCLFKEVSSLLFSSVLILFKFFYIKYVSFSLCSNLSGLLCLFNRWFLSIIAQFLWIDINSVYSFVVWLLFMYSFFTIYVLFLRQISLYIWHSVQVFVWTCVSLLGKKAMEKLRPTMTFFNFLKNCCFQITIIYIFLPGVDGFLSAFHFFYIGTKWIHTIVKRIPQYKNIQSKKSPFYSISLLVSHIL